MMTSTPCKLSAAVLAAVLVSSWLPSSLIAVWIASLCLLLFKFSGSRSWSIFVALLAGSASLLWTQAYQLSVEDRHEALLDDRAAEELTGEIVGPVMHGVGRLKVRLQTDSADVLLTIYGQNDGLNLLAGQHIRVFARLKGLRGVRNLGSGDHRIFVMNQGAELAASALAADVTLVSETWSLWRWPESARRWAVAAIASRDRSDGSALVTALTTGQRSGISDELAGSLRISGLAHLLAVSGMHLAAITSLVFLLLGWLWGRLPWRQYVEPRTVAAGGALVAALLFTLVTGGRPSTCRALLVASLMLVGVMIDRRIRLIDALAWTASLLLLWRPTLLWDPGFQMSFAAAFALALAFASDGQLRLETRRWPHRLGAHARDLLRASFWATLATAPFALYHFGEVSWLGLLSNLVAVPLTTLVLLPGALLGLALTALGTGIGGHFLDAAITLAQVLADLCLWIAGMIPAQLSPGLNLGELALWGLMAVMLLPQSRWLPLRYRSCVVVLSMLVFLGSRAFWMPLQAQWSEEFRVTFVDIDQGDAAVLELPGGGVWLVDGGGLPFVSPDAVGDPQHLAETPARQSLLPYLRYRRIDRIDLAIVSHPHPDHYVGLRAVAREIPIVELWSAVPVGPGPYWDWLHELEAAGTKLVTPGLGRVRVKGGVELSVLWPQYLKSEGRAQSDPILSVNDNSLVVRADFAGRRFLFPGDIEEEAESLLVESLGEEIRADVVKVPHHGSPTSSTSIFVHAVSPILAIISCGRGNRFGFPGPEVEERWRLQAQAVFRTDQVGSVTVRVQPNGAMTVDTMAGF